MNIEVANRYKRNIPAISSDEQEKLKSKKVLVVGCGGLGGFVIEQLARLGIGEITLVDGDVFEDTNLNRQLYSSLDTINKSKVLVAKNRITNINPDIKVNVINEFFSKENADEIVKGHDLIIDALDNVKARLLLEDIADKHQIVIVHGAVQSWNYQVSVVLPGSKALHKLYKANKEETKKDEDKTCLVITPTMCAAMQVSESLKVLLGYKSELTNKVFMFDLKDNSCVKFEI